MTRRLLELRWSAAALHDVVEILAYVALDVAAAGRVEERIVGAAEAIPSHPERGRVVPELRASGVSAYREVVVAPYRLVYRAASDAIHVVAVLHGARDLETVLHRRLTRAGGNE